MIKKIEGNLIAGDKKFVLVASRFNEFITTKLVEGALDCLLRHGANEKNVSVVWVPGAFELPVVAAKLAGISGKPRVVERRLTSTTLPVKRQKALPKRHFQRANRSSLG